MSKGNMLLGQARGKVGDLVFYVRNGSQQTRPRNRQPANPQTRRQMAQRVKLGAPVGFYKRQAKFFQFAFKKKEKESFYNAFMRYNMNLGAYLTREEVVNGYKVPGPYIIADGNMPSISVVSATNITDSLQLALSISATTLPTWGEIKQRYGLLYGDMMTIVVFDTQSYKESLVTRVVIQHVFDAESDNMPMGYDMAGTTWSAMSGRVVVDIEAEYFGQPQFHDNGSAVVLSRNNGNIDCSFAQLTLNDFAQEEYDSRRTAEALELAITSYADIDDVILDPMSADDNYSDVVKIYSGSDFANEVTTINWESGGEGEFYYKAKLFPNVSGIIATKTVGSEDPVSEWNAGAESPGSEVGLLGVYFSTQGGYAEYNLNFVNSANVTVGVAHVVIQN